MADVYGMDYGPALFNHWVHVAGVFNNGNMTNYSDMFMPRAGSMVRTVDAGIPHMFWRLQANP